MVNSHRSVHCRPLPTVTSRGVKYTHNDIKHSILDPDRGPTRIRLVPQEHPQKKVKPHTPTEPHNVADPHAVPKVHTVAGPKALTPQPTQKRRTA